MISCELMPRFSQLERSAVKRPTSVQYTLVKRGDREIVRIAYRWCSLDLPRCEYANRLAANAVPRATV